MTGLQVFLEGRDGLLKLFRECFGGNFVYTPMAEEVVCDNNRAAMCLKYAVRCCREEGRQVS